MNSKLAILTGLFAAALAGNVQAAPVTETYNFSLSNFVDIENSAIAPIPTVTGSFTVTFDPFVSVSSQTTGFTFSTTPGLTSDSAIGFTEFAASSPTGEVQIAVGGIENGPNFVSSFTNDPIVFFDIPNASNPGSATLVVCSQPGFNCGNFTGNKTVYASGYSLGNTSSIFFATSFTTAVPEPSTWAMMILGFAGIGAMTYRRRKSAMLAA